MQENVRAYCAKQQITGSVVSPKRLDRRPDTSDNEQSLTSAAGCCHNRSCCRVASESRMLRILRFGSACHRSTHAGHHPFLLTDLLTRLVGTGETGRDAGDGRQAHRQVSETGRDAGDVGDARRGAHNPEVAGSNPAPATNSAGQGPLPVTEGAFSLPLC